MMINPELAKPEWKLPPPGAQSATSTQRIEAIVYENHQAFPHYLVTYSAGPRQNPYGGGLHLRNIDDAPDTLKTPVNVRNGVVASFLSGRAAGYGGNGVAQRPAQQQPGGNNATQTCCRCNKATVVAATVLAVLLLVAAIFILMPVEPAELAINVATTGAIRSNATAAAALPELAAPSRGVLAVAATASIGLGLVSFAAIDSRKRAVRTSSHWSSSTYGSAPRECRQRQKQGPRDAVPRSNEGSASLSYPRPDFDALPLQTQICGAVSQ